LCPPSKRTSFPSKHEEMPSRIGRSLVDGASLTTAPTRHALA
jgi:hypothetical protein